MGEYRGSWLIPQTLILSLYVLLLCGAAGTMCRGINARSNLRRPGFSPLCSDVEFPQRKTCFLQISVITRGSGSAQLRLHHSPLARFASFHPVPAGDLLPFTTKCRRDLPLKRERYDGGGRVRQRGRFVMAFGTSGCLPAVSLARCHAASCPERARHVLPFHQSDGMDGC